MLFLFCWVIWSIGRCKQELEFEPAFWEGEGLKTLLDIGYSGGSFTASPVEVVLFFKRLSITCARERKYLTLACLDRCLSVNID